MKKNLYCANISVYNENHNEIILLYVTKSYNLIQRKVTVSSCKC